MLRPAGLVVLGLSLSLLDGATVSARARQTPARVVLDYRKLAGAERCPSRAELEGQVSEILGHRPFARTAKRTVRCVLRGAEGGIGARVQLLDTPSGRVLGVRELSGTGPGCAELGGAVALAIALAIDPLAKPPARRPPAAVASASGGAGAGASTSAGTSAAAASMAAASVAPSPIPPAPRSVPPTPRLVPDAGPLAALGLVPLVVSVPDAGARLPAGSDAGAASPDAGVLPDAGPPDAGPPVGPLDSGVAALPVDAGPEVPVADAGVPPVLAEVAAAAAEPPPAPSPTGWRPVAGAGAVGVAGALPGFAGGVLVHAGAASSTASVEAELRWLPGTSLAFGSGSISTSQVSGVLVGCARFGNWAACGLTQAGPLNARGQGYSETKEVSSWVVSVGARAQWEWVFADPIGLRLHLDAAANLLRPRLLIDSQEAWATPPFSVSVGGGLFGRF